MKLPPYLEKGRQEAACPRCGTKAIWGLVDTDESSVAIICPVCGSFEISRDEIKEAQVAVADNEQS